MSYKYIISVISVIWFCTACDDEPITIIDSTDELKKYDYYVDEFGNEGIVAYLYDYDQITNYKCAIVISADETDAVWGPRGFAVLDTDIEMLEEHMEYPRFSLMMSRLVTDFGQERFPAFKWCMDKNHGEPLKADSWLLPSYHEYAAILKQCSLDDLNEALAGIGGMPVKTEAYWTCTEDHSGVLYTDDGEYDAINWAINLIPSNDDYSYYIHKYLLWDKTMSHKVRAIKYIWLVQNYDRSF